MGRFEKALKIEKTMEKQGIEPVNEMRFWYKIG